MNQTEPDKSGEKSFPERANELLPFVPKKNSRMTADEQLRFEKKVRAFLHDAVMKGRGKQWDLALADVERALKISTDLGWQEGMARAVAVRDAIAARRSSNALEQRAKVATQRYEVRRMARKEREATEHARIDALLREQRDRLKDFALVVAKSKKIDVTSLAGALGLDEASARDRAAALADKFGFSIAGSAIVFEKGDKEGFLKAILDG